MAIVPYSPIFVDGNFNYAKIFDFLATTLSVEFLVMKGAEKVTEEILDAGLGLSTLLAELEASLGAPIFVQFATDFTTQERWRNYQKSLVLSV